MPDINVDLPGSLDIEAELQEAPEIEAEFNASLAIATDHRDLSHKDAEDQHPISAITGLEGALSNKANIVHNHAVDDVIGLQSALDDKADQIHVHEIEDVTGLKNELDELQNGVTAPKYSVQKLRDYFYQAEYDYFDYARGYKFFRENNVDIPAFGCTSVRNGDIYGRNFDWVYSTQNSYAIHVKAQENRYESLGMAGAMPSTIPEDDIYALLPFFTQDGINEYGLVCNTNVVPTDYGYNRSVPTSTKLVSINGIMLVRYILDHFKTATEAVNYISAHVEVWFSDSLHAQNYEQHYMIADTDKTYVLEFVNNTAVVIDVTNRPYMTNFYLHNVTFNADGTVYTPATLSNGDPIEDNGITEHGSGLERYNYIVQHYTSTDNIDAMRSLMTDLLYTKAYNTAEVVSDPYWYTEFVGEDIHCNAPVSVFTSVVDAAGAQFAQRTRNDPSEMATWQSVHSVIYDIDRLDMDVIVQEDTSEEWHFSLNDIWNELHNHIEDIDVHIQVGERESWNAKADISDIPTELSELTDDEEHRTVTDEEKQLWNTIGPHVIDADIHITSNEREEWNAKQDAIEDLEDIRDHVDNGTIHVTASDKSEWSGKQDTIDDLDDIRSGSEAGSTAIQRINGKSGTNVELTVEDIGIGTVFTLKGSKETYSDLPTTGNMVGDVWYVRDESVGYIWMSYEVDPKYIDIDFHLDESRLYGVVERWEKLGESVDLSDYVKNTDYATSSVGGVVKTSNDYALEAANGILRSIQKTLYQYTSGDAHMVISKGTLEAIAEDLIDRKAPNKWLKLQQNASDSGKIPVVNQNGVIELQEKDHIPTALSELTSDSTHRTVTDVEKAAWNEKEVFVAEYGVTTVAEIDAAVNAGKIVTCIRNEKVYGYYGKSLIYRFFVSSTGIDVVYLFVHGTSSWDSRSYTIEQQSNKVTSLSSSSTDTQYPSAKAVYEALPVIADELPSGRTNTLFVDTDDETVDPAVRWDVSQNLTADQKSTARKNVGSNEYIPDSMKYEGRRLNDIFADADALHNAISSGDFSNINLGDYWEVDIGGKEFRNYSNATALSGSNWYTDYACENIGGVLEKDTVGEFYKNGYCASSGSPTKYYKLSDCLKYEVASTANNESIKFEVAGIDTFWNSDKVNGTLLATGNHHVVFVARDGLSKAMKMACSQNDHWCDEILDIFIVDNPTGSYTISNTNYFVRNVSINYVGVRYNTSVYTVSNDNTVTFKAAANLKVGDVVMIGSSPSNILWENSPIYKTFNDENYGIYKLIHDSDDGKLTSHMYNITLELASISTTRSISYENCNRGKLFIPMVSEVCSYYGCSTSEFGAYNSSPSIPLLMYPSKRMKKLFNSSSRDESWLMSIFGIDSGLTYTNRITKHNRIAYNYPDGARAVAPSFIMV